MPRPGYSAKKPGRARRRCLAIIRAKKWPGNVEKPENDGGAGGARCEGPYRRHIDLASKAVASFSRPYGRSWRPASVTVNGAPFVTQQHALVDQGAEVAFWAAFRPLFNSPLHQLIRSLVVRPIAAIANRTSKDQMGVEC